MTINLTYKQRLERYALARGLNPRVLRFVVFYCQYGDHKKAAIRVGYPAEKADKYGKKLLNHPKVRELVERYKVLELEKLELNSDSIVKRLTVVANARIDDYLRWTKTGYCLLTEKSQLTAEQLYAIETIEKTKDGFKIKLMDRMKALENISRWEGSFNKSEITIRKGDDSGFIEPPLEALTTEELDVYKKLVQKMLDYKKDNPEITIKEDV